MMRIMVPVLVLLLPVPAGAQEILPQADGYRGVWYQNGVLGGEYGFKYSGGLGTYCAKHRPFAVHRPEVGRTFFCYGGVPGGYHDRFDLGSGNIDRAKVKGALQHMVSYYDHRSGTVPRPTVLLDKGTHDAHDNPVISVDDAGHVWILSTAHGATRPAFVHRGTEAYGIRSFERIEPYRVVDGLKVPITNFSYMQVWHPRGRGFVYFFTQYRGNRRETCFATSADGIEWGRWTSLAEIEEGHYQVSAARGDKAACAFNHHPRAFHGDRGKKGLNWRTNLYYLETPDFGKTWRAAGGTAVEPPVREVHGPALVRDYEKEGRLVYLKDLVFDGAGRPVILFLTAAGYLPGPASWPRTWHIARWSGEAWEIHDITESDSNYDMGSLFVEAGGVLRLIAPTAAGPQPGNPGGEVVLWESKDDGATWREVRQLTADSAFNHTYVRRPVDADPGFQAFWADGDGRRPSVSRLYFCDREGRTSRLPERMREAAAKPAPLPATAGGR